MPIPSRRIYVTFPPAVYEGIVKHRDAMGFTDDEAIRHLVVQALSADPHRATLVTAHYEALAKVRGPVLREVVEFFRGMTRRLEESEAKGDFQ